MKFHKEKLKLRLYQNTILNSAFKENTLVVIPTGLGKTFIAAALAGLKYKDGKILFLAPTKPLVNQHKKTFETYFDGKLNVLSGEVTPTIRKDIWSGSDIIFSTPQTIRNDLGKGRIGLSNVSLIIFDEAHRAVGSYAYVYVAKTYLDQKDNAHILGLTASPGSEQAHINKVKRNLFIKIVESRTRDHPEVKDYVEEVEAKYILLDLPKEFNTIQELLKDFSNRKLETLKKMRYIPTTNVSKKHLLSVQNSLIRKASKSVIARSALSIFAQIIKLNHAIALLESESLSATQIYLSELKKQAINKENYASRVIFSNPDVKRAYSLVKNCLDKGVEHPKLIMLKQIVENQLEEKPDSKILIFTEYRNNIPTLLRVLASCKVKSERFIGQAAKKKKGMSQKEQLDTLNKFKEGKIQILVSTSVGEEGLDVPSVDLVIFYSPVPSAIRSIQRKGRTGRNMPGKITFLIAKNTKDQAYYWIARRKEKKMQYLIKDANKKDLNDFMDE